jgi:hypothetical protein
MRGLSVQHCHQEGLSVELLSQYIPGLVPEDRTENLKLGLAFNGRLKQ